MALDPNLLRVHSLPRLDATCYQADAAVLWTLTTFDRAKLPLTETFHLYFRELLLHAEVRENLLCPAYVLMPDHLHLVWLGTKPDSNQLNTMRFLRTYLAILIHPIRLQPQSHDHVFTGEERRKDAFAKACQYVLLNPPRAKLVSHPSEWPFYGASIPGYPKLDPLEPKFWSVFWKIFSQQRDPACGAHIPLRKFYSRPPVKKK